MMWGAIPGMDSIPEENLFTVVGGDDVPGCEVWTAKARLHLAESYELSGKKGKAIENYEESIRLNPDNEKGKEMLEKLMSE